MEKTTVFATQHSYIKKARNTALKIDTDDFEHVGVLIGPASVLYGWMNQGGWADEVTFINAQQVLITIK